jgi:AraC family ethanolamine operon transcriptional activator
MDHIINSPKPNEVDPRLVMELSEPNDLNKLSAWDIDFRQIEPGRMKTVIRAHSGKSVNLIEIGMSKAVHQNGVSPKGQISLGLPYQNSLSTWQGQNMETAQLVSFGSSQEFDGVGFGEFRGLTISIDVQEAERLADMLGFDIPYALRGSVKYDIDGKSESLAALNEISGRLLNDTNAAVLQEEAIISNVLIAATSFEQTTDKSSPKSRSRAVNKAIEMMISSEEESLEVSQICREIGVSWRTLDRAFSEKFGISPKQYYLRMRLNWVRTDLLQRAPGDSISDIINGRGYWHMGKFAQDYCKMFDELPSRTTGNLG